MEGYIKLYRKLLDNPIIMKDNDYLAVWIYLLLNATHKEIEAVFNGEKITLHKGQLITGRKSISEKLGISESKTQRVLKCFESEHQIEQQTTRHNRLITILMWKEYQVSEQQNEQVMNNKRTTNEQLMNTNNNVKNIYINLINKYKGENPKTFYEKMRFLRKIKNDDLYKNLTPNEEYELRNLILAS